MYVKFSTTTLEKNIEIKLLNNFPKVQISRFTFFSLFLDCCQLSSLFYDSQSRNILLYISFCGILKRTKQSYRDAEAMGNEVGGEREKKLFDLFWVLWRNACCTKVYALSSSCETKSWKAFGKMH